MRNATGPNSPPGGSTKVNGQEVTATTTPRTVKANIAYALNCTENLESGEEPESYDADEDAETTAFLSQILSEAANDQDEQESESLAGYLSPDYTTTRASAMMMADDFIMMDEHKQENDKSEVEETNAIMDRLHDHTRVCALEASVPTYPSQADTAAPEARTVSAGSYPHEKSGESLASRKGPDLGGSKAVGVRDPVVEPSTERFLSVFYFLIKTTQL